MANVDSQKGQTKNSSLVRAFEGVSSKEDPDTIYELVEHIGTGR